MNITLTVEQRIFMSFLFLSVFFGFLHSTLHADVSLVDKEFLEFTDKYVGESVGNQNSMFDNAPIGDYVEETKKTINENTQIMIENDSLTVDKYKSNMQKSYDEAFSKVGKKETSEEFNALRAKYPENTKELDEQEAKAMKVFDSKSLSEMEKELSEMDDLKITVKDEDDSMSNSTKTIKVFDSKKMKQKSSKMKNAKTKSMNGFACLCEMVLQKGFKSLDLKINELELSGLIESLDEFKASMQYNIDTQKEENMRIENQLNSKKHEIATLKMITIKIE